MRTNFDIASEPTVGDFPDVGERLEQVWVEHFFAVAAVEALDEGVLVGFARLDVAQLDSTPFRPVHEGLAGELGAVVTMDGGGLAVHPDQLLDETDDLTCRDAGSHVDAQYRVSCMKSRAQTMFSSSGTARGGVRAWAGASWSVASG